MFYNTSKRPYIYGAQGAQEDYPNKFTHIQCDFETIYSIFMVKTTIKMDKGPQISEIQ